MTKAEQTRQRILSKAFELIYVRGYQAASIDEIIATTDVTKGAFFYHFKNKEEMGLAIVEEIVRPILRENFIAPLKASENPLATIYKMMEHLLLKDPFLKKEHGCPAGNLVQEMAPYNDVFFRTLSEVIGEWKDALEDTLRKARKEGQIRKDVHTQEVAIFIMSGYWGVRNLGKIYSDDSCYRAYLKGFKSYLKSLE
jgi:TetR/AcrR family transcriptional repressor of nem operon